MTPDRYFARQALTLLLMTATVSVSGQDIDDESGLMKAEGWEVVKSTCTECHAGMMITQNAGNLAVWESRIRWMQETQGLRALSGEEEATILSVSVSQLSAKASSRRAGLPAHLLPINPTEAAD